MIEDQDTATKELPREMDAHDRAALDHAPAEHRARVERLLEEIRGALDARARDKRYKEFSATRLVGAVLQALVVGLMAWSLSDWVFQLPAEGLFIKLAFAAVLQLIAMTALLMSKEDS